MTREEMLKLAAEKGGTPQEIMAFVREMEAFLKGDVTPAVQTSRLPREAISMPIRNKLPWKQDEIDSLRRFMKEGKTASYIANMLWRSEHAIKCAMWKVRNNRQVGKPK